MNEQPVDTGEELSEQTAPFGAIVSMIYGKAEITIVKHEHVLTRGRMIIIPAHKPHAIHARQQFRMLLTMIHE